MLTNRSLLLATACALPFSLVACGGSDSGGGTVTPTGTHYGYVVNKANVVPTAVQGQTFIDLGLDLGSPTSSKQDGKVDNSLGQALGALAALGFGVQATVDTAINTGAIILLVDFQTTDFTNAAAAGFEVKFGTTPNPPACANAQDTVCGGHLKGGATIAVSPDSPSDAALSGKVVNGTFNGDPGNLGLSIVIGDATAPINLNLVHARAQATGITADGMTAKVGGLVTQTELQTSIAPAILTSVNNLLAADGCKADGDPKATPACGCTGTSQAVSIILSSIDGDLGDPKDCKITVQELLGFQALQTVLKLDSCSTDSCSAPDSYSIGVAVTAVKATIQ
jgi:hypothetical protein